MQEFIIQKKKKKDDGAIKGVKRGVQIKGSGHVCASVTYESIVLRGTILP
jgi:hypothetical protein